MPTTLQDTFLRQAADAARAAGHIFPDYAACEAALASVLGRPVPLCTLIEPALIAGLELAGTHAVVRNSWRDQLEQIRSGLQGDDGRT